MLSFDERIRNARFALKTGNLQVAMDTYTQLLGENPQQPQLYFERGTVAQLGQRLDVAEHDYRMTLTLDPTSVRARENLGQIVRRTAPFVGAPRSVVESEDASRFIYAVGSSYTRSFSSTTLFLPLWLGPANELSFISDDRAARTQAHLLATIERCDLRNPVLLVMGNNDPINHADNLAGTKDLQVKGELGSHAEIIEAAALRYTAAIEAILARFPGITLFVLAGCVMYTPEHNEYIRISNRVLEQQCARLGVPFVDINDELADPETGLLRVDRASNHDDTHLSKKASVELVGSFLAKRNLLPDGALPFEWSFLWQAPLSPEFMVRIWGEPHTGPSNLVHSRTVAFNHVLERALHIFLGTLAAHAGAGRPSVLIPHCREGLVPLSLPLNGFVPCTALDSDPATILMARRLAGYFGRPDITFITSGVVEPHDYVFVALRDEVVPDAEEFLDALLRVCRHTLIVLSTLDWSSLGPPATGMRIVMPMADATTRPPWDKGTILIQRQA